MQGERGIYTFTGSNASKEEKIASKNLTEYIKNHDLHDYQNANEAKEIGILMISPSLLKLNKHNDK